MTCEWREKVERYADLELGESELAQMEEHLRTCPECAATAMRELQMKRQVSAAAAQAFAPTAEFRIRIENKIGKHRTRRSRFLQFGLAVALIVLTIFGTALLMRQANSHDVLAEAIDLHVSALASTTPVDVVSTDRHTVKPWFEGKLPFTFSLPELQGSEFHLAGGRMAYVDQSPGAQLIFGIRKHQISVFIFQDRESFHSLGERTRTTQKLEFNLETWSGRGLRYVVISDAGPADVAALSQLLRDASL